MNPRRWSDLVGDETGLIVDEIAPGALRLSECIVAEEERSYFYLVRGRSADCLIDGGWGFCCRLGALRGEADRPLIAIATHSHFDHIGMLHLAARRHAHPAELQVYADPNPLATQALPYIDGRPVLAGGGTIDPVSIRQEACPIDLPLGDCEPVDLGGRRLLALHTPGHSPGSLSLLEPDAGLLFCADTVHDGHIWDDIPGADRHALLLSHERLAGVEFARACPGHGAILTPAAFLDRIALYRRQSGA